MVSEAGQVINKDTSEQINFRGINIMKPMMKGDMIGIN